MGISPGDLSFSSKGVCFEGVSAGFCQIDPNSEFHTKVSPASELGWKVNDPFGQVALPLPRIRCWGGEETSQLVTGMKGRIWEEGQPSLGVQFSLWGSEIRLYFLAKHENAQ